MSNSTRDEIAFIRECAARGLSRSHTAQLLGFWPADFIKYLDVLNIEGLQWQVGRESLLAKNQLQRVHESRRGAHISEEHKAILAKYRNTNWKQYTAFGVTGTLPALVERFGAVGYNAVLKRMTEGMPLEQALTQPRMDQIIANRARSADHPWRKRQNREYQTYVDRQQSLMGDRQ